LRDNLFTPIATSTALFAPPSRSRMMIASAPAWEKVGAQLFESFGGVLVVEAAKQIYAATPGSLVPARRRRPYVAVPGPVENMPARQTREITR
jgi:hypothetical protein